MLWEKYCEKFIEIRGTDQWNKEIKSLKDSINKEKFRLKTEDFEWLKNALLNEQRKWFVVFMTNEILGSVSKKFYPAMIHAAIYEENPSFNRSFIEPCIKTFGHQKVNYDLLNFVRNGTNREKAGAVNALYWSQFGLESDEIIQDKNSLFLKEFCENEDLNVRRSIIPALILKEEIYSQELKSLVKDAIEIARASNDEYIRHRIEVQLGNENRMKPLPHFE